MDARVADIALEAGVARGSFYTYFPSKREAFREAIDQVNELIMAAVAHAPDDIPGHTLAI